MKQRLNIVFAGTPPFAATILSELITQHNVIAVYTQPDRPAGRGQQVTPSAVKQVALTAKIPVHQPTSLKTTEAQTQLAALTPDVMVVVAYGLILPTAVLNIPRYGCLNVHASLLPRWRGAAPIQRAIQAGDGKTGVTIMQMDAGLDTGDMLFKKECAITSEDTSTSLHDKLAVLGAEALLETLSQLDQLTPESQSEAQACYAHKIQKQEGKIDWHQPASTLQRLIMAFNPWPGTFTHIDGKPLKIWKAEIDHKTQTLVPGTIVWIDKNSIDVATGEGVLKITECQLPGKKRLPVADILNAHANLFTKHKRL